MFSQLQVSLEELHKHLWVDATSDVTKKLVASASASCLGPVLQRCYRVLHRGCERGRCHVRTGRTIGNLGGLVIGYPRDKPISRVERALLSIRQGGLVVAGQVMARDWTRTLSGRKGVTEIAAFLYKYRCLTHTTGNGALTRTVLDAAYEEALARIRPVISNKTWVSVEKYLQEFPDDAPSQQTHITNKALDFQNSLRRCVADICSPLENQGDSASKGMATDGFLLHADDWNFGRVTLGSGCRQCHEEGQCIFKDAVDFRLQRGWNNSYPSTQRGPLFRVQTDR